MGIRFGWSAVFGALLFLATLKMAAQEKPDDLHGFSCPLPAHKLGHATNGCAPHGWEAGAGMRAGVCFCSSKIPWLPFPSALIRSHRR
jgi:uncharacterized membrane protein YedE/YeeE